MKPDKISVYDLFDRQRRYVVPLYQRQYVWEKDAQWTPLWEDICDKARLVQLGESKAPHFLGAIVTSQRQVFGNEIGSWDIIDGQQRLTTLQIVLTAFRDVVHSEGDTRFDRDLHRITRNEGVMRDPIEKFKVWPTNSDRSVFVTVMDAGALTNVIQVYPGLRGRQKRQTPRLAEAYAFFYRAIERFIKWQDEGDASSSSARIDVLFETFRRYLQIVNIELEADDDPQVIFESLNGRGVPLLPSDLVRNFVFMRANRDGADLDLLYRRYWRVYDERRVIGASNDTPWWKHEERQGRINRPRLDLFLFHYLQYRLEREVNIGHLFQEFRTWWGAPSTPKAEDSLAEMQRYAEAFATWLAPVGAGTVPEFARWLKALDTSTVYPVMFLLLVELDGMIEPAEVEGIVADLESYLVRRAICRLTNKQYNRHFMGLLRKLRKAEHVSRASVREYLSAATGDSVRWPDDEEFGRAFVHRPAYRALKREVTLMTLLALERAMVTSKHEEIEIAGKLSIEHVMPQDWQDAWKLEEDSDEARETRERLLHAFGNLTLVTPQFNTALSNKSFIRKQKELRRIARFLLSACFDEITDWNERGIVARGKDMFDVARRRWPHPASPEAIEGLALDVQPESTRQNPADDSVTEEAVIELETARAILDAFVAVRRANGTEQHLGS